MDPNGRGAEAGVRLIRSKGGGVFVVTQTLKGVPAEVLLTGLVADAVWALCTGCGQAVGVREAAGVPRGEGAGRDFGTARRRR